VITKILRRAVAVVCLGALLVCASVGYVDANTRQYRYEQTTAVPREQVALVFGAGVRPDGRLSRMLADRVTAAVDLYVQGRVDKLLMSGDNSHAEYDEVTAMKRYAVERGVPEDDITLDYAGFSTYESCYRARAIFGVTRVILVTQRYHLPRAVYTCRQLGIDAVGIGTADWGVYRETLLLNYTAREVLATLKALVDVHLTRPLPTFLGPFEGIE
jgi:vancomycin permeability regulator SanA